MKEGKQTLDVTATGLNCIFLIMETKKQKKNLFKSTRMPLESNFCIQLRKVKGESLETSLFFVSELCAVQQLGILLFCFTARTSSSLYIMYLLRVWKGEKKKAREEGKGSVGEARQTRN